MIYSDEAFEWSRGRKVPDALGPSACVWFPWIGLGEDGDGCNIIMMVIMVMRRIIKYYHYHG